VDTLGVAYHPLETLEERARTLAELSTILAEVGSDHAVIGGIAVGYHGRLRATVDVDMLVPRAKLEDLAHALRARGYVVAHTQDMVRVYPPAADPDHDGINNLLEYAFALNPMQADARLLQPGMANGQFTLAFAKRKFAADLTYRVDVSNDLVNWDTSGAQVTQTVLSDGPERLLGLVRDPRFRRQQLWNVRQRLPGGPGLLEQSVHDDLRLGSGGLRSKLRRSAILTNRKPPVQRTVLSNWQRS